MIRYDENTRELREHYCYLTNKYNVLFVSIPDVDDDCDEDGYIVAEYEVDEYRDIQAVDCLYNAKTWDEVEKNWRVVKFLGIGYDWMDAVSLLIDELEENEDLEMVAA